MKRKTFGEKFLVRDDWVYNAVGHLVKGGSLIPRAMIALLGTERNVRRMSDSEWMDLDTGYIWPEAAFTSHVDDAPGCSCGAKHTSLPQLHSEWCLEYRKDQR